MVLSNRETLSDQTIRDYSAIYLDFDCVFGCPVELIYAKMLLHPLVKQFNLEIEEALGDASVTGHLKRLEEDYELIKKKRPIFAEEGTQTVRYEIPDMFLRFWFRHFIKYNDLIESQNLPLFLRYLLLLGV